MGFFDFFNSEYRAYKKIYEHFNHLPATDEQFRKAIDVLIPFYTGATLLPLTFNQNLTKDPEKLKVMIAYFAGAADYMSQALELEDRYATQFIVFYLVLMITDGEYKKFGEFGQTYLDIIKQEKYYNIMLQGGNDFKDMLKGETDSSVLFMRLKKLL